MHDVQPDTVNGTAGSASTAASASGIRIRPATAADSETIKRMVRAEPLNPNAVDWRYFYVLDVTEPEGDTAIIASIAMAHPVEHAEGGPLYEIDSVTTRPQYRKRGYSSLLLRAVIDCTPRPIYLLAEPALVAFYERLGFRITPPADAPAPIREEAAYVNARWGTYHIMGLVG
ncbi:MAG: GNAT family N-acetyltransferase [bacterium]|nr:GNAT family N-acetyltransferase [bacterium]